MAIRTFYDSVNSVIINHGNVYIQSLFKHFTDKIIFYTLSSYKQPLVVDTVRSTGEKRNIISAFYHIKQVNTIRHDRFYVIDFVGKYFA